MKKNLSKSLIMLVTFLLTFSMLFSTLTCLIAAEENENADKPSAENPEETPTEDPGVVTTDSFGATITTKVSDAGTSITYSMKAGPNGTDGNYLINKGGVKDNDDFWRGGKSSGGVIYKIPILFANNLIGVTFDTEVGYVHTIDISVDGINYEQLVKEDSWNDSHTKYHFDLSEKVATLINGGAASYLYIRHWHDLDWNAPRVYGISVQMQYDTVWESDVKTDDKGAVVSTLQVSGEHTEKKFSLTSGRAGTGENYLVNDGHDGKVKEDSFCGGLEEKPGVVYKFPIEYASNTIDGFVISPTLKSKYKIFISTKNSENEEDWTMIADGKATIKSMLSFDITANVKTLLTGTDATEIYVRFYHDTDYNSPIVYGLDVNIGYDFITTGSFAVATGAEKNIVFGHGSIDPAEWLVVKYALLNGTEKEKLINASDVDVEWFNADTGASLGTNQTPTAIGNYKATVKKSAASGLRYELAEAIFEGFSIVCDHTITSYACSDSEHWLVCDGCGAEIADSREAHDRDTATWSHDETNHKLTCKCGVYHFVDGAHDFDGYQHDLLKHWQVCKDCAYQTDSELHTWDAGKVTKEATADAEGVKTYTCSVCSGTKTESIAKLPASATTAAPTEEPAGCSSSVNVGGIAIVLCAVVGVTTLMRKKKKEN